jgi:hypothetical protein
VVPVLESERIRLRGHTLADFEASAAMWGDERVTRFIGGKPSPREDSWRRFMSFPGHWALLGYGYWLIEEKATGAYVGDGGFGNFKRDLGDYRFDAPEQGWALNPAMHGSRRRDDPLGGEAFRPQRFRLHDRAGKHALIARRRKARLPRIRAHGLQGRAVDPASQDQWVVSSE